MNKPPSDDKRSKYPPPFSMRLTEDERRVLELAAAGRPLAAYMRWLIFKEDMPELPKRRTREQMADPQRKELSKLLGTLGKSRISQNINQLAKAANSGSLPVNQEVIEGLNQSSHYRKGAICNIALNPGTVRGTWHRLEPVMAGKMRKLDIKFGFAAASADNHMLHIIIQEFKWNPAQVMKGSDMGIHECLQRTAFYQLEPEGTGTRC